MSYENPYHSINEKNKYQQYYYNFYVKGENNKYYIPVENDKRKLVGDKRTPQQLTRSHLRSEEQKKQKIKCCRLLYSPILESKHHILVYDPLTKIYDLFNTDRSHYVKIHTSLRYNDYYRIFFKGEAFILKLNDLIKIYSPLLKYSDIHRIFFNEFI